MFCVLAKKWHTPYFCFMCIATKLLLSRNIGEDTFDRDDVLMCFREIRAVAELC
jgi:hypothetical protein